MLLNCTLQRVKVVNFMFMCVFITKVSTNQPLDAARETICYSGNWLRKGMESSICPAFVVNNKKHKQKKKFQSYQVVDGKSFFN